jgi:signal transduction histidine kinase
MNVEAVDVSREPLVRARLQQQVISSVSSSPFVRSGDLLNLSQFITEQVAELLQIERVSVWLFNTSKDELICQDLFLRSAKVHSAGAVLSKAVFQDEFSYLAKDKYVDANDPYTDPRTKGFIDGYLTPNGITAMLDGVVRIGEELIGTVCFEYVRQSHQWSEDEIVFVSQLGDQVALAVSIIRSNLIAEELRKREHDLQELNLNLERLVQERTREIENALVTLKHTQTELLQREKLASLGKMVAGIAHELNTPIGNSLTVASTLEDKIGIFIEESKQSITRKQFEDLLSFLQSGSSILMKSLQRAVELISSFKQVAVDQVSMNRRTFNLHETINEILVVLDPQLHRTLHTIENLTPKTIMLESYPGPLGQVLTNLINNAILHGFEGVEKGKISIEAELLKEKKVRLTVSDNGRGISKNDLPRIFDPFFTTRLGQGGSGLGLNIVYNLVTDLLNGSVSVKSKLGEGSSFVITLPLRPEN